jgi:cytoskeletal protein RodZ
MANARNPSYSGGSWFKVSLGKKFMKPYLKRMMEWLKVEAEFKLHYCKKKKKEDRKKRREKNQGRNQKTGSTQPTSTWLGALA